MSFKDIRVEGETEKGTIGSSDTRYKGVLLIIELASLEVDTFQGVYRILEMKF